MKTGNLTITIREGIATVKWSSPVVYLSYAFMGKFIEQIDYVVLPRFDPYRAYRRVVNKDWAWWPLYYAWDWIAYHAGRVRGRIFNWCYVQGFADTAEGQEMRWRDIKLGGRNARKAARRYGR